MIGGGALDSMNKSIKYNLGQLKTTSAFEKIKQYGPIRNKNNFYTYKKATDRELAFIRSKIIREQSRDLVKLILLILIFMLIGAYGLSLLF